MKQTTFFEIGAVEEFSVERTEKFVELILDPENFGPDVNDLEVFVVFETNRLINFQIIYFG